MTESLGSCKDLGTVSQALHSKDLRTVSIHMHMYIYYT